MKQSAFDRLVSKMKGLTPEQRLEIFEKHLGLGTTEILDSMIATHKSAIERTATSTSTYKASPKVISKWKGLVFHLIDARRLFNS